MSLCTTLAEMRRKLWRRRHLMALVCVLFVVYFSGKILIVSVSMRDGYDVRSDLFTGNHAKRFPRFIQHGATNLFPKRFVHNVSCKAIVDGDKEEIEKAKAFMTREPGLMIPDSKFVNLTADCDHYRTSRGFLDYPVSLEEYEFPLSFSVLLYKEVEQLETLLKAIYRPHNVYCIHVDADAPLSVHAGVDGIAKCLENVFVVSRKEFVVYSGFTRLQADLNCMADLLASNRPWKYFINLPSQEFPLKTNSELVQILKAYNGASDVEGITGGRRLSYRFTYRHGYKRSSEQLKPSIFRTSLKKEDPPRNATVVKGSAYGAFHRDFVDFALNSKAARELLDWFRDVLSPDEYFWATLNFNPHLGTPGAYQGPPDRKPWLVVHAKWGGTDKCAGKFVHGVCVFGVGDLQSLVKRRELFANKFHKNYQPLSLRCMEEWLHNRTVAMEPFNVTYYENLDFVKKKN